MPSSTPSTRSRRQCWCSSCDRPRSSTASSARRSESRGPTYFVYALGFLQIVGGWGFFSALMVYLRWRGFFRADLDADVFGFAYLVASTTVVWPLLALAATWVIGPCALVFIVVIFVLALMPIEALAADERHPEPATRAPESPR